MLHLSMCTDLLHELYELLSRLSISVLSLYRRLFDGVLKELCHLQFHFQDVPNFFHLDISNATLVNVPKSIKQLI